MAKRRILKAPPVGALLPLLFLADGCKPGTRNGVEYQNCGGVLYRAGMQSSDLVCVVQ